MYSASKAWTATVALMLVEQGVIGLDDLVTDYLPGYGQHGKGATTLGARAHPPRGRALPARRERRPGPARRPGRSSATRSAHAPDRRARERLAYHALTAGYLVGEIVQVVTGQGLREVLREQILRPLGSAGRTTACAPADVAGRRAVVVHRAADRAARSSTQLERTLSGSMEHAVVSSNDPRFLTAVVPSANVVTTAFEMSRFYEMLRRGGELDGVRVLQPDTLRLALTQTAHLEPDRVLGWFPVRYGVGYMLGARYLSLYGQDTDGAFGHLGLSNVIGWADPRRALSAGLITTGKALLYPGIDRFLRLTNRIAATVPKIDPADQLF